jgi:hypothetical protein
MTEDEAVTIFKALSAGIEQLGQSLTLKLLTRAMHQMYFNDPASCQLTISSMNIYPPTSDMLINDLQVSLCQEESLQAWVQILFQSLYSQPYNRFANYLGLS